MSGTLVNMAVLYLGQNFLFAKVHPFETRLHFSLALAIFLATMNNYLWNRWWTWGDRKKKAISGFFTQMFQYYLALRRCNSYSICCHDGSFRVVYYLVANAAAIVLSAIFVYILNNVWTFRQSKMKGGIR